MLYCMEIWFTNNAYCSYLMCLHVIDECESFYSAHFGYLVCQGRLEDEITDTNYGQQLVNIEEATPLLNF